MRSIAAVFVLTLVGIASAAAQKQSEFITAPTAILCVEPDNVDIAHHPDVAGSPLVLRSMGCLKPGPGIRTLLLDDSPADQPWRVRFYPEGISGGITLWALPSSLLDVNRAMLSRGTVTR
jgi:hypothetical protein